MAMKMTTLLCCGALIVFGLCACITALTGFDVLRAAVCGNETVYRALLSFAGVAALWLLFWLVVFRPTRPLR